MATIARIVPQLLRDGKVRRPETGIVRVWPDRKGACSWPHRAGRSRRKGQLRGFKVVQQQKRQGPFVYQYQTVDRSAADLIVAVDGKLAKTADEFLDAIESRCPGEQVALTVIRGNQQIQVPLVLDAGE